MEKRLLIAGLLAVILTVGHAAEKSVRLIAEAEDFKVVSKGSFGKGDWQVVPYRENYFASTFAMTFLSRMACLGAPEQIEKGQESVAEQEVNIPYASTYEVLSRYEAPYNFSVEFTVEVEQKGKTVYSKLFGRYDDVKIWSMMGSDPQNRRKPMVRYFWGATDNIVWQNGGSAKLAAGPATIRLIAGPQKQGNPARRHVDLICLTNDQEGREAQKKYCRTYLEMDGWLVQDGDLFIRFKNLNGKPLAPAIAPNNQGQHSPYYVHLRDWPSTTVFNNGYTLSATQYMNAGPRCDAVNKKHLAPMLSADGSPIQPGKTSGWVPMGQVLDALHNCIWTLDAPGKMEVEFAIPDGKGGLKSIRKITVSGKTSFEMPGNIAPNPTLNKILEERYWLPVIRTQNEALQWLLVEVKKFPKKGSTPKRFLIYNIMGWGGLDNPIARQIATALGDNTMVNQEGKKRGIRCHWRNPDVNWIEQQEKKQSLNDVYIVSYGDEIHLPAVNPGDAAFAAWLKAKGVNYNGPVKYTTNRNDPLYYYSKICAVENGAKGYIAGSAYYKSKGVLTGANYSPHSNYLVTEMHYIRPFKMEALTMPWSEDYVWQVPEFSVQVVGYLTTAFRAAAKYHDMPIHMYVMPHSPGNTPRDFRLSFYTCIAHGAKMINYFCASPLAVAGTENYVATDDLTKWKAIHDCTHAAGLFEDYVVDGKVRQAKVALLLSSVDDIMTGASNASFAMHNNERKAIYYALRHAQVPVDFLSEDDVIDGLAKDYQVIYLTQQWLHSNAVKALASWVEKGGTLVALCGGGFSDEFNKPNRDANALYGVKTQKLDRDPDLLKYIMEEDKPFLTKQDLPPYKPFDFVNWGEGEKKLGNIGVIVWKQTLAPADGTVIGKYKDGKPAIVEKKHGKGKAVLFGFLPGQAYLKSGLPLRPVDRGSTDNAFTHFLPIDMNVNLRYALVDDFLPEGFVRPVVCSEPLVESTCIDTQTPAQRLAVPLMNYTGKAVEKLTVTVNGCGKAKSVSSVEQGSLKPEFNNSAMMVTIPLGVTDMLLIDL